MYDRRCDLVFANQSPLAAPSCSPTQREPNELFRASLQHRLVKLQAFVILQYFCAVGLASFPSSTTLLLLRMGSRGWGRGPGNWRGRGSWNGGNSDGNQVPPDAHRQIDAANAAARTAQQNADRADREANSASRQAAQDRQALQDAQQALADSVERAPPGRRTPRNSLPVANPTHMSSSSTSLTRGPTGYMIHPTLGTIPNYVPPRAQARSVTVPLAHTPSQTPSTWYLHPSLGVMQNVTVPVPISVALPMAGAQGLLTQVHGSQPSLAPALPPPAMSLGTGSGTSSLQTVVH